MRGAEMEGRPQVEGGSARRTFVVGKLTRLSAEIHLVESDAGAAGPFRVRAVVRGARAASAGTVH